LKNVISLTFQLCICFIKRCIKLSEVIYDDCSELLPEMFESLNLPESYRINSNREKLALSYAENFRKQFVHLYRDRKPLLLSPMNELQVEASYGTDMIHSSENVTYAWTLVFMCSQNQTKTAKNNNEHV